MKLRAYLVVALAAAFLWSGVFPADAQAGETQPEPWTIPRAADDQPDLQGISANNVVTPPERPVAFEGKDVLTDEELAELGAADRGGPGWGRCDSRRWPVAAALQEDKFEPKGARQ